MFQDHLRRKRQEQSLMRSKITKNVKRQFDQSLPLSIRPERVSAKTKELIYELEAEYIKRHNILVNNRKIYKQILESMATELDGVGITPEILMEMYKEVRRGGAEEGTQAEE